MSISLCVSKGNIVLIFCIEWQSYIRHKSPEFQTFEESSHLIDTLNSFVSLSLLICLKLIMYLQSERIGHIWSPLLWKYIPFFNHLNFVSLRSETHLQFFKLFILTLEQLNHLIDLVCTAVKSSKSVLLYCYQCFRSFTYAMVNLSEIQMPM